MFVSLCKFCLVSRFQASLPLLYLLTQDLGKLSGTLSRGVSDQRLLANRLSYERDPKHRARLAADFRETRPAQ